MTQSAITHEALTSVIVLAIWGAAGLLAGFAYFAALSRTVALFASGGGWLGPVALTLVRLAAAAGFFVFAVRFGATPLLAAFAGFLAARAVALRRARTRRTG